MPDEPKSDPTGLFGDLSKRVVIEVEGQEFDVPARLELLRCFQFLGFDIEFERFCWNANCENCTTGVSRAGRLPERCFLCQLPAEKGMVIAKLPEGIRKKGVQRK